MQPRSAPLQSDDDSLRGATARGFLWTGGQALVVRAVSLLGFLVLVRLLTPHDYGLAALAMVFAAFVQTIAVGGFARVIVQRAEVDETELDTTFWMSVVLGFAFAGAMFGGAWPLAELFDEPELRPILQVLSLNAIALGFSSVHQGVLQRRLAFSTLAKLQIVASFVATAVSVVLAGLGYGVWALIVQANLLALISAAGQIIASRYRPGRSFSWSRLRSIAGYTRHLMGSSVMSFLNHRTDDLMIGAVLGSVALGIYTIGYRLLTLMMEVLAWSTARVAFPVFARFQTDRERLREAYGSAARMSAVVTLPCFMFVFAAAPELTQVMFGSKWEESVPVMRVLCLYGALYALLQFSSSILQGVGRARTDFRLAVAGTLLQIAGFAIVVQHGIVWIAVVVLARALVIMPFQLAFAGREVGASAWTHLAGFIPAGVSAAGMVGAIFGVKALLDPGTPDAVQLPICMLVALAVYVPLLRLSGPREFAELLGYLRVVRLGGRGGGTADTALPSAGG